MAQEMEILILDDEEIVCARLKPALEKNGYRVETYTDSVLAKKRLEEHPFHIVVTDLKMAGIDGMELFQFVKDKLLLLINSIDYVVVSTLNIFF